MERRITVISEPAYASTYWYTDTLSGMREYTAQKGWPLDCFCTEADPLSLERLPVFTKAPVILLGTSGSWIDALCGFLQGRGDRVLTVGGAYVPRGYLQSSIFLDFRSAMNQVLAYLGHHGRHRAALLGINPASVTDAEKAQGFGDRLAVFRNEGDLADCVDRFLERSAEFDAVICSNDVVALLLLQTLRDRGRPPLPFFVVSFGNTLLGELTTPSLTSVTLNYREVGRQAVTLWELLRDNLLPLSLSCRVGCRIIPRETTGGLPTSVSAEDDPLPAVEQVDNLFYKDRCVEETLKLEQLVSRMDLVDCRILLGVRAGRTYEGLSEELHISDGTVKYRLKRMLRLADCPNRDRLCDCIDRRVGFGSIQALMKLCESAKQ